MRIDSQDITTKHHDLCNDIKVNLFRMNLELMVCNLHDLRKFNSAANIQKVEALINQWRSLILSGQEIIEIYELFDEQYEDFEPIFTYEIKEYLIDDEYYKNLMMMTFYVYWVMGKKEIPLLDINKIKGLINSHFREISFKKNRNSFLNYSRILEGYHRELELLNPTPKIALTNVQMKVYKVARYRPMDFIHLWQVVWEQSEKLDGKKKKEIRREIDIYQETYGIEYINNRIKKILGGTYDSFLNKFKKKLKEQGVENEWIKIRKNLP